METDCSKETTVQFSSVAQLCPTLCDPMDCCMLGLPVHHHSRNLTKLWEILKDREAWSAVVHGIAKSQKGLSD